jgi:hypothetical protein
MRDFIWTCGWLDHKILLLDSNLDSWAQSPIVYLSLLYSILIQQIFINYNQTLLLIILTHSDWGAPLRSAPGWWGWLNMVSAFKFQWPVWGITDRFIKYRVSKTSVARERIIEYGVIAWHTIFDKDQSLLNSSHDYHSLFTDVPGESFTAESWILSCISQGREGKRTSYKNETIHLRGMVRTPGTETDHVQE